MEERRRMRVLLVGPRQELDRVLAAMDGSPSSKDASWVSDPDQALQQLGQSAADVVVADGRIGEAQVESLLSRIRDTFPDTACVLFDTPRGGEERPRRSSRLSAIPRANDHDSLQALIDRSYQLQRLLTSDHLRRGVGALDRLPSVPRTYWALTKAVASQESSVDDVAQIVESDPVMSAKVLQLVNSAYFGLGQQVTSISRAVSYMGMEVLKGLVLTAHVFMAAEKRSINGLSLDRFQLNSIRTARLAQRFLSDPRLAEEAFTGGLLHDIGEIILAMKHPEEAAAVLERSARTGEPTDVVERNLIGITHAEAGAFLLSTWGIPFTIVECVAFHHHPSAIAAGACEALAAVHAADTLIGISAGREAEDRLDEAFLRRAGFGADLPRWRQMVEEETSAEPGGMT